MPRIHEDDDRDDPQEIDLDPDEADDEESDDTVDCPECGRTLHWSAPRCPGCGTWLPAGSAAGQRSRRWAWPILVAVLVAVILVMWNGLGR